MLETQLCVSVRNFKIRLSSNRCSSLCWQYKILIHQFTVLCAHCVQLPALATHVLRKYVTHVLRNYVTHFLKKYVTHFLKNYVTHVLKKYATHSKKVRHIHSFSHQR